MCYNVRVRTCNVGANSLNVALSLIFSVHVDIYVDESHFILEVEKHFRTQFEHFSSYVFLCAGRVLLPAISTARRWGAVFVRRPKHH